MRLRRPWVGGFATRRAGFVSEPSLEPNPLPRRRHCMASLEPDSRIHQAVVFRVAGMMSMPPSRWPEIGLSQVEPNPPHGRRQDTVNGELGARFEDMPGRRIPSRGNDVNAGPRSSLLEICMAFTSTTVPEGGGTIRRTSDTGGMMREVYCEPSIFWALSFEEYRSS